MNATVKEFLNTLPTYDVLHKRFQQIKTYLDEVQETDELIWGRYEDGSGGEGNIVLYKKEQKVLLYGYDHESSLNFFGEPDYKLKQKVFIGIPSLYETILTSNLLLWDWDDTKFVYATNAYWLDNKNIWKCYLYKNSTKDLLPVAEINDLVDSSKYTLSIFLNKIDEVLEKLSQK